MKRNGSRVDKDEEQGCPPRALEKQRHICSDKIRISVQRWKAYIYKYCNRSGLHGLNYVSDVRRPCVERFLWLLVFCVSLTTSFSLIRDVWIKWKTTPVIVTFAETPTPVWEIPFPAVTICSQNKIGKPIFNIYRTEPYRPGPFPTPSGPYINAQDNVYEEPTFQGDNEYEYEPETESTEDAASIQSEYESDNNTDEESTGHPATGEHIYQRRKRFYDMSQWCNEDAFDKDKNFTDYRLIQRLNQEAPRLEDTIGLVRWKNHEVNVTKYFRPVMTQNGRCFTFNMLDDDDIYKDEVLDVMQRNNDLQSSPHRVPQWSADGGYTKGSGFNTYPARTPSSGLYSELYVVLKTDVFTSNFKCKGPVTGFKVQVHSPDEVPGLSKQFFRVPLGEDIAVAIRPNAFKTADELRDYSPSYRQCYFSDERYLRFFRKYTQRNCELECYANETLEICDCVPFFMPRTEDTPICNLGRKECLKRLGENRVEKLVLQYENDESIGGMLDATGCGCLPSCSALDYETEIFQSDIDGESYVTAIGQLGGPSFMYNLTGISVYFKNTQFFGRRRSELYGMSDLIGNCGGTLGLFTGFSILSLVEVIYFFTIRVGFSVKSKRNISTQTSRVDNVDTTHL